MSENANLIFLSLIVFLPALSTILLAFFPRDNHDLLRYTSLAVTGVVLVLTMLVFFAPGLLGADTRFDTSVSQMQDVFQVSWIPSFDIFYFMGVDGISLPLIVLTVAISFLAMAASWSITKHVKAYCILFLLLETGMIGVFMALDFFLFYVFWEVMLLPMYFLIGVWGGPRREYAAIKFFLYTLVGGVLMLIAMLLLFFNSDVRKLALADLNAQRPFDRVDWNRLHLSDTALADAGVAVNDEVAGNLIFVRSNQRASESLAVSFEPTESGETRAVYAAAENRLRILFREDQASARDIASAVNDNPFAAGILKVRAGDAEETDGRAAVLTQQDSLVLPAFDSTERVHTFNMLALAAMGQKTDCFDGTFLSRSLQWWAFILLFIGFIIKVPSVPFHTWLPDAHVEAPTPISMILAGVLLKMGGYGIIRICYPICPQGAFELAYVVCLIGVVSMVYGGFAALAQRDFKRMVAYSSVSHMGYVVLGLGVWSAVDRNMYDPDYWIMGVKGAMYQMVAHGISSAGMFFMVGVIYDRVHHRNLNEFGGLFGKMPVYTALSIGIFFAGLGLPGLCGFIGEVFVVLSVWKYSQLLAVIAASVVILTAGYILWAIQRVYLGAEYRGPHEEALSPSTLRENLIAGTLFVLAIIFGVYPRIALDYMDATIDHQVEQLAEWTRYVKEPSTSMTDFSITGASDGNEARGLAGGEPAVPSPGAVREEPAAVAANGPALGAPPGSGSGSTGGDPPPSSAVAPPP